MNNQTKKIRKAVIPVAGLGTRFLPITKTIAKEMLPIVDRPAISYIIEECIQSGIEEIIFITSERKKQIENYVTRDLLFESRIKEGKDKESLKSWEEMIKNTRFTFINQQEQLGSGHAIYLAKEQVGEEDFAILYGDDVMVGTTPILKQLIDVHDQKEANVIGVKQVPLEKVSRYGMIAYDEKGRIKRIVEKPKEEETPSLDAGLGRYIVSSSIFHELEQIEKAPNGEYQLTDALTTLMQKEEVYPCQIEGTYYDIGNKLGYLEANLALALEKEEMRDSVQKILKKHLK